jgi:hypothetical protein
MATADDESSLFERRDKDLRELYPTDEAWERSQPILKPPSDPEERRQYDDFQELYPAESRLQAALQQTESSANIGARRQRELDAHDRLLMRGAADASRDALHDNGPGLEPGTYTKQEARDRAAHAAPAPRLEPEK